MMIVHVSLWDILIAAPVVLILAGYGVAVFFAKRRDKRAVQPARREGSPWVSSQKEKKA